jgi:UDP-glucose:glycoprotein glucosyltransferase
MSELLKLPWSLKLALVAAFGAQATPSVNIGMKAAFPAGPYLLELMFAILILSFWTSC